MRYPIAIETGDEKHAYGVVVPERYVFATVGKLSARKFLINWCARRDSNSRPPGS